ncbi:baseplate J/gp47 family protein [Clostridium magnum]|uniref:Baseplate J-like protein n=1 Tax=Clostridium magnum DSM 2767 TaxID=1121326 RepID=A0A161XI40_9CLOT|nr:baseplate J/gp47 family protein [Clostridium magnum]KZL94376.1 baseplate J-like protein [Clostridium magnum DSM 2767]SHJ50251.1 Uncharacterized phage protein gp47/JayE [Clostridium magnum DSM 2767]
MAAYSESEEIIRDRILSNMSDTVDKTEGYIAYDSAAAFGKELSSNRAILDEILAYAFPQTSSGTYLDYNAESRGVTRNLGVKSKGQVVFTGVNNTVIQQGTIVQTNGGLQYTIDSNVVITNGSATANITATAIGTSYNIPTNTIIQIPIAINGVTSVTNSVPTTGGTDDETDLQLIARLLQKVQNPPSSGNKTDYERWAKEVSGVLYVKVIPLANGPGTIKLVVAGENGAILDSTIIKNVQDHLKEVAPILANVTVVTVSQVQINTIITGLTIKIGYNLDDVKLNVETSIRDYLSELNPGDTVNYNNIRAIVTLTEGVSDFTELTLNTGTSNITTTDEQKAVLSTITYS